MIRFIIKHRFADNYSGASGESFHTLLLDVPELEAALRKGGHGTSGFEYSELTGIELIEDKS